MGGLVWRGCDASVMERIRHAESERFFGEKFPARDDVGCHITGERLYNEFFKTDDGCRCKEIPFLQESGMCPGSSYAKGAIAPNRYDQLLRRLFPMVIGSLHEYDKENIMRTLLFYGNKFNLP